MYSLINTLNSFISFSEKEMQHVLTHFKPLRVKKGDVILKEGDVCTNLWFVVSGCVMLITNKKQEGKIVELLTAEYFFGEVVSFLKETPTEFCLEAVTDTELYTIAKSDYEALDNYCENWHRFRFYLLEKVCQYMTLEIMSLKMSTNEERYNRLLEKRPFLFQIIPQYIIANYLDMTPVGLSKLRGRLTGHSRKAA